MTESGGTGAFVAVPFNVPIHAFSRRGGARAVMALMRDVFPWITTAAARPRAKPRGSVRTVDAGLLGAGDRGVHQRRAQNSGATNTALARWANMASRAGELVVNHMHVNDISGPIKKNFIKR